MANSPPRSLQTSPRGAQPPGPGSAWPWPALPWPDLSQPWGWGLRHPASDSRCSSMLKCCLRNSSQEVVPLTPLPPVAALGYLSPHRDHLASVACPPASLTVACTHQDRSLRLRHPRAFPQGPVSTGDHMPLATCLGLQGRLLTWLLPLGQGLESLSFQLPPFSLSSSIPAVERGLGFSVAVPMGWGSHASSLVPIARRPSFGSLAGLGLGWPVQSSLWASWLR